MNTDQLYYYQCYTLIDITPTGVTSHDSKHEFTRNQQRNWETIQQIISLRTQPNILETNNFVDNVAGYGFGINYTGQHKIWTFKFAVDYPDIYKEGPDIFGLLRYDLKITPLILGLTETACPEKPIFYASGPWNNIYFKTLVS